MMVILLVYHAGIPNHTNCDFNQSLTNHNTVQFFKNDVIGDKKG